MASLALLLLLLWIIIHGLNYLLKPSKSQAVLPIARGPATLGRRRDHFWNSRTTQVILNKLHLRVQTSVWNTRHDNLAKTLSSRHGRPFRTALTYFYNAGCFIGVLGTLVSLGFLVWSCGQTLLPLVHSVLGPSSPTPGVLLKRGLDLVKETATTTVIKPIIPGVTVPLGHLPIILAAVFASQIIHELGHAISAALDAVPIISAGASFTVVVPAAFVTFPTTSLEALKPSARLRIVAAGPFHNFVFWCFLALVGLTGIGDLLTRMLYHDVSHLGRVVIGIDSDSALGEHLALGSLITKLDDTRLGSGDDRWTRFLTSPPQVGAAPSLGWCVDRGIYTSSPQSCCEPEPHAAAPSQLFCFASSTGAEKRCLDPIPILTVRGARRCDSEIDCSDASCVRLDTSAHLLRITVVSTDKIEQVILWSGPPEEVYEQVEVGTLLARYRILPLWIYLSTKLLWEYLKMATLSLYLFNLLPLPYLDGSQFVQAMLGILFDEGTSFDEYDIEALEVASSQRPLRRNRAKWKERLGKVIPVATCCLFVVSAVLALINVR